MQTRNEPLFNTIPATVVGMTEREIELALEQGIRFRMRADGIKARLGHCVEVLTRRGVPEAVRTRR